MPGRFTTQLWKGILLCIMLVSARPLLAWTSVDSASILLSALSCDHQVAPLNLDQRSPVFGWQMKVNGKDDRNVTQTAYQVQVASSKALLEKDQADYWDSKKTRSSQSVEIPYAGKSLSSFEKLYWRVRVWTSAGVSGWSPVASWRMGLLKPANWTASWVGWDQPFAWDSVTKFSVLSARYLRKGFKVNKKVKSAIAYISGLGLYELHINGRKIGDAVLAPAPTDYSKTVLYNALDVTDVLQNGKNAIGVILGNGRYFTMRQNYKPWKWHHFGFPKLYFQLRIEYDDGSHEEVVSGPDWQLTGAGPIRANNEYDGEIYNSQMELDGWDQAGYQLDSTIWHPVEMVRAPEGKMKAQNNPPMKVMRRLDPVRILPAANGGFILDLGQNMAGWLKMHLDGRGHGGDTIALQFAESLTPVGDKYELYTANLRDAKSTDHYIIKGSGSEDWSPKFVYHGFRYVAIKNYPGKPVLEDFKGEVVFDEMATAGHFECSDSTINQVYHNAVWGILSNYKGMPVDCPQRNERQPWLGDRTTGAYGESFAFGNQLLYDKWISDIADAQLPTGSIPDVAPSFWFYYKDDVTWPSTYFTVADMLYHQYGNKAPILRHYGSMKFWIQYMHHRYAKEGLLSQDSYGDWCVPPDSLKVIHSNNPDKLTPGALLATATFYHDLRLMAKFAAISGNMADTALYNPMAREMKVAFQKAFFHADSGYYGNNTVTGNLLPLAFGLADKKEEDRIFEHIVRKTVDQYKGHISSGVIGIQWFLRSLSRYGRNDLAVEVVSNRDYPGWGYMVDHGATTIWELWNGNTANPAMNSQNHVMLLGDLLIWLYENQAGIRSDVHEVGFKKIQMAPKINGPLQYVKADYDCPYGKIISHWRKTNGRWQWSVTIPVNTSAELNFPSGLTAIREDGKPCEGLKSQNGHSQLTIGSGSYVFTGVLGK